MRPTQLPRILRKYSSGWVSIAKDYRKAIAWGKNLKSLIAKLNKMGNPEGYLMKVARDYSSYVG